MRRLWICSTFGPRSPHLSRCLVQTLDNGFDGIARNAVQEGEGRNRGRFGMEDGGMDGGEGRDDRKSFSYFGYRFAGMPVRLVARFGIPRRQFCGRVQATRCSRGCHARIAANRFLSLPSLSFFVLIKLGGEKNISATVHPSFLEGDIDSSFELFVIRFG